MGCGGFSPDSRCFVSIISLVSLGRGSAIPLADVPGLYVPYKGQKTSRKKNRPFSFDERGSNDDFLGNRMKFFVTVEAGEPDRPSSQRRCPSENSR